MKKKECMASTASRSKVWWIFTYAGGKPHDKKAYLFVYVSIDNGLGLAIHSKQDLGVACGD